MVNILTIPRELRDQIWSNLSPPDGFTHGISTSLRPSSQRQSRTPQTALKLSCRQLNAELTESLYRRIILECRSPGDFLPWIVQIGSSQSSAVENLTLKTRCIPSDGSHDSWLYETGWAFALRCVPKLRALTIHFEYFGSDEETQILTGKNWEALPALVQQLSETALECCEVVSNRDIERPSTRWDYQPTLSSRQYTHGVFSLNERMPSVLVYHWNKSTRLTRNVEHFPTEMIFKSESMEENLTGLTSQFFEQNGLTLTNTCTFSENNEHPNAHLTFTRKSGSVVPATDYLRGMLQDLSSLQYLRVGSNELDSTFLTCIPKNVNTLDVAFTDNDPQRVADNIIAMRLKLWNLFTLAIEVSPLHDRKPADEDDQAEHFFDRRFVSEDIQQRWTPFWEALDDIRASKVKVWEGEGPGFRRSPRRINGAYIRS